MWTALVRAWRAWSSARGVALLSVTAFAVGIGSATAIYTVVNGVLLRPLPYAHAERFVAIYNGATNEPNRRGAHTFPDLLEYEQRTHSFDAFGWFTPRSFNLTFAGVPQQVSGVALTPSLAAATGVQPSLGQWFTDDSGIVISNALWRRLGSEPSIVGRSVALDGRSYTVTGVMPPGFRLPVPGPGVERLRSDLWLRLDPLGKDQSRSTGFNFCYARLKPGATLAQAEEDVRRAAAEIAQLDPPGHEHYTAIVDSLREAVILEIRPVLLLTAAGAALLLLLTCADVAGLLLARAVAHGRDIAIRIALGARRRHLALHYFLESLMVSVAGAVAGVALSAALVRLVISVAADFIPRADEITLDASVLLFAIAVACAASAAASLAPLWQAFRTAPTDALNEGVRSSASVRTRRVSHALVVAQIALAFTLLATGAALVVHLWRLQRVAPGFNPDNVLAFQVTRPEPANLSVAARAQEQQRFTTALEQIPGVTSVGIGSQLPLEGCCYSAPIYPEGRPPDPSVVQRTSFVVASPQYLTTLQVPLRAGRLLDARDTNDELLNAVVNETAARRYWPNANALGAFGRLGSHTGSRFQVIGIVGDVRNDGLDKPPVPGIYISSALLAPRPFYFLVRSQLPAATLLPEVRRTMAAIDPGLPLFDVTTLRDVVDASVSLPRLGTLLTTFFALAALLMATLGVYGVVSYAVRQSTVELGTRMALGAIDRELLGMVVGSGLKLAAIGIAIGVAGGIGATWLLARTFDLERVGVLPFVASTVVIGAVTLVASFVPARRVAMLSPMVAIRNQPGTMPRMAPAGLMQTLRGVSRAFSAPAEPGAPLDDDLLSDFVAAARNADSYAQAFEQALATLRARIGASWTLLLEHAGNEFRPLDGAAAPRLSDDGFAISRVRRYSFPLPISAQDLDGWIRWAHGANPAHVPELQTLQRLGVRALVGLRAKDDVLGLLLLGAPLDRDRYSSRERIMLRQCAEQLTLMIENARLTTRVVEQEKVRRDLALAAEVQRRLLPERAPEPDGVALSAFSVPARSVGGDYYDFIELGDHRVGIALADIAGKGVAAALIMAVVQASLRIVAADGETSLPQLAARINDLLHRSTLSKSYATFFYAQLDETGRRLRYVNAGHNPPYLMRPPATGRTEDVEIRELNVGGMVLGLFPEMAWDEATVELQPGDVLIAFTDGVTEALNVAEEEFGEERLKAAIRGMLHLTAAEISARLSETLRLWIKDTAQYDDLTFVVLKVV